MTQAYLVSLISRRGTPLQTSLWETEEPFGIGHPFRWTLESTSNGIRIRDLSTLQVTEYTQDFLQKNTIELKSKQNHSTLGLKIYPYRYSDLNPNIKPSWISAQKIQAQGEEQIFKKSLKASITILVGLVALSFLVPQKKKEQQEELIPPQFAKMLMTSTSKGQQNNQKSSQSSEEGKNKATNLVKAFQSKQVQRSTQALLKGGVLSLLSKSDLLSSSRSQTALKSLFDQGKGSQSLAKLSGSNEIASVVVGTQGGKGSADGSLGYGQGQKAGIEGQGNTFVSLDSKESMVEEGLTKEEVGNVIHSHVSEIRYCYESAMIKNPDIQGKLMIDFVIAGKGDQAGNVRTAKVNQSTLGDSHVDQCILAHLNKWKFPKPKGGVEVAVTYPFLFKSLGK